MPNGGAWIAALLLAAARVARADEAADAALEVLNTRNIVFSPGEFLDLVERDDADNVRIFLQAGMSANAGLEDGHPVLVHAASRGFNDTVRALLDGGALVNAKNHDGYTALMLACLLGREDTTLILLDRGADPDIANRTGKTALMFAVEQRRPALVEAMLKRKADPAITAASGVSALSIALDTRQEASLNLFERAGYGPRLKALKARFERELVQERKLAASEERDRQRKLKQQLQAAGKNGG